MRSHPHPLFAPADALAQAAASLIASMQDEALDPQASIFSEEAGGSIGEFGWIVDPLDGTVNYASGLPWFSVTLAYLEEGKTVFGVAHAPKARLIARYSDHGLATLNDRPVAASR